MSRYLLVHMTLLFLLCAGICPVNASFVAEDSFVFCSQGSAAGETFGIDSVELVDEKAAEFKLKAMNLEWIWKKSEIIEKAFELKSVDGEEIIWPGENRLKKVAESKAGCVYAGAFTLHKNAKCTSGVMAFHHTHACLPE
jgi:hypothetical protein